jgi:hypothetical protein
MKLTRCDFLRSAGAASATLLLSRLDLVACAAGGPATRPGRLGVHVERGAVEGGKGFQNLIPSPMNPIELAGGEGHLRPIQICMQPSQNDRDTRVEVVKLAV